jgi:hypothetical protein
MRIKVSHLIFFLICAGVSVGFAQTVPKGDPFTVGETLTFEGKVSKAIVRGISVADLAFTVSSTPDNKYYVISTQASSKGSFSKLFKIKFRQVYESTVDKEKFRVLRTVKHDEQGDRIRDGEATFDYQDKRVTYVETNPKDMMRPPRKIASAIREDTLDLVSGIYYLRRLPLAVGKTFELSVSDSGFVYKIPVRITARELQDTILGKVWCFRVEPEVFGNKRLIEDEGSMILWITEDARRIPVRAQIHAGVGKIEIKLKKISK